MRIPFLDLAAQHDEVAAEALAALTRVASGGVYVLAGEVAAFEEEWARYCGVTAAAGTGTGTDALALALQASGAVRPGRQDEVITSTLTAAYTGLAILSAGGLPVFCDIDPQTLTLDPQSIECAITPRTRAIVPVHLYGRMADMNAICDVAARHNLLVIEDAAQAHGARLKERRAGAHSHAAAFSFYPTKNLGAYGDGGAVVSNDAELIEKVKILRQGGHAPALTAHIEGRNSRLDEMQAALLRVKLKRLDEWNRRRRRLADFYHESFHEKTRLQVPRGSEPGSHVYHLYVVQHEERDALRVHIAGRGIETMIHYPYLLHQQPLFKRGRSLSTAEHVAKRILSLPLNPQLKISDAEKIVEAIIEFDKRKVRKRAAG
ncbi:MAG: DegT/DnrJ/EryC1/StrS family aminotransferase [Pyrinomonadaceae bacterium]|nr:DegT/DnrJ/EryC1/StrS family aminotransferase [Pyrinomonadaceae bacterium]